jgi:hypothetical protein
MEGFMNRLLAAFQKKSVFLVPVANKEQATYMLKDKSEENTSEQV